MNAICERLVGTLPRDAGPFGIVRQLLEPVVVACDGEEREALLAGAAALAKPVLYRLTGSTVHPGRCQSAASHSAWRFAARSRTFRDGRISGLGGCKIASQAGRGQDGNAWPRSP